MASPDAATAKPHPGPQIYSAKPQAPRRDPPPKAAASPTQYTNRKNRPRKSDKSSDKPHEIEIQPTPYPLPPQPQPSAKKSSDAPTRLRPSPHKAPQHAPPAQPPPPK